MPRLIITGVDTDGKSIVSQIQDLEDIEYLLAWEIDDSTVKLPLISSDAPLLEGPSLAPGQNAKWSMMQFPPGGSAAPHRTHTIDYDVVLRGTIDLELDDGVVSLSVGDCVVMTGVPHSWRAGADGAIVSFVGIGAIPAEEELTTLVASKADLIS